MHGTATIAPADWSEPAFFGLAPADPSFWKAEWIGAPAARPGKALQFRAEFVLDKPVRSARIYLAGIGWHELRINGGKIGDRVLEPAQTDFSSRVLYSIHDITAALRPGKNVAGIIVGAGWYGVPKLIAQLEIEFADGSRQTIVTGKQKIGGHAWLITDGPIVEEQRLRRRGL